MKIKKYQKPSGPLPKKSFWWNLANQLSTAPSNGETTIAAHNADLNRQVSQAREEAKGKGQNPDRAEEEIYRRGLRTNGAIVGGAALGALATTVPAVAETVKFATKTPVGKKALQKVMKDTAISMAGGTAVDALSDKMTGMSFGRYVAGAIPGARNLYDRSGLARFGIDMLNPGYLGLSGSKALIEGTQNSITNLAHKVDNAATIANARLTGKLKFGNPTTYTGIHQSNTPLTEVKFPFNRWDVTTHGADPNGFWLTLAETPNTKGTMASRPFASRWTATSQKPLIQTGEIHNLFGGKNSLRNTIVNYGKRRGADAFEFRGIKDNALPTTNVVMVTDKTNPTLIEQIPKSITDTEWDAAYNAAVKSGNIAEAQRLRDLHFKAKAPNAPQYNFYHGTFNKEQPFYIFEPQSNNELFFHFSPYKDTAEKFMGIAKNRNEKGRLITAKLNIQHPTTVIDSGWWNWYRIPEANPRISKTLRMDGPTAGQYYSDLLLKSPSVSEANGKMMDMLGSDALMYKNYTEDAGRISVAVPRPSQIKLADPITYDDAGKVIPLSKRDDFNNPDIRYDLPRFAGKSVDTTNPTVRQTLVQKYKERYPLFQQTPEKEFVTSGDGYYEVGKIPFTEDLKLHKDLIRRRLDNFNSDWRSEYGYYTDPTTHIGNMYSGENILNKAGENGITVVVPKERAGQFGGFYNPSGSRAGESFTTADAWRSKPVRFTQLHESVSHPTDMFVRDIKSNVSGKSVRDLYNRVTQPSDLFPDFKNFFKHDASELWYEGRSTNNEMIKRINEIVSKKTGKRLTEVYNNPELLEAYVNTNLKTNEQLVSFLESMDNGYLADYASLLKAKAGTKEANVYANRIRNMIKILFGISVPIAVTSKQK